MHLKNLNFTLRKEKLKVKTKVLFISYYFLFIVLDLISFFFGGGRRRNFLFILFELPAKLRYEIFHFPCSFSPPYFEHLFSPIKLLSLLQALLYLEKNECCHSVHYRVGILCRVISRGGGGEGKMLIRSVNLTAFSSQKPQQKHLRLTVWLTRLRHQRHRLFGTLRNGEGDSNVAVINFHI